MEKIILLALAMCLGASVSFAQPAAVQKTKAAAPAVVKATETMSMAGKIKSVTLADPAKGIKSEIAVVNDQTAEKMFLVKATTTIYGPDFKAGWLDNIKVDDKVKVKYAATKEGVFEATSINLVK